MRICYEAPLFDAHTWKARGRESSTNFQSRHQSHRYDTESVRHSKHRWAAKQVADVQLAGYSSLNSMSYIRSAIWMHRRESAE